MHPSWSASPMLNDIKQYVYQNESLDSWDYQTSDEQINSYQYPESFLNLLFDNDSYLSWNSDELNFSPAFPSAHRQTPTEFNCSQVDVTAQPLVTETGQAYTNKAYEGIYYDPNDMFDDILGCTEIAVSQPTCNPDVQNDGMDVAAPSMKKPSNKRSAKRSPNSSIHCQESDWTIIDETSGKQRSPLLHEFLRQLLDNTNYSDVAGYVDREQGIFKFYDKDQAAKLWQQAKGRNCDSEMTYEKFSRAIRHYYEKGIMRRCHGRFTFRFDANSGFGRRWLPTC